MFGDLKKNKKIIQNDIKTKDVPYSNDYLFQNFVLTLQDFSLDLDVLSKVYKIVLIVENIDQLQFCFYTNQSVDLLE
jgi:hypothetical protein